MYFKSFVLCSLTHALGKMANLSNHVLLMCVPHHVVTALSPTNVPSPTTLLAHAQVNPKQIKDIIFINSLTTS